MPRGFHLLLLLLCYAASCRGVAAPNSTYPYKPPQKFTILAQRGTFGIDEIQREHSVNKQGKVAFIGQTLQDGVGPLIPGLFTADIPGSTVSSITGFSQIFASELGPAIYLNDKNEILTRRINFSSSPLGPLYFSYFDRWALDSNARVNLAYATLGQQFQGFYGPCAQNSAGSFGFIAFSGSTNYLAMVAPNSISASFASTTPLPVSMMMSNGNARVVLRLGDLAGGSIRSFSPATIVPLDAIASPSNGFSEVGARPGINHEGTIIVFYGNLTAAVGNTTGLSVGKGIFAYFTTSQEFVRLAGINGNGQADPGEYWNDTTRDGVLGNGEQDIGLITDFQGSEDAQVAVNNQGCVAFLAMDSSGKRALFFSHANPATVLAADPYCVIATGDAIPGLGGTVTDLALSDSLGDRQQPGDLVFWASTSSGDQAIVTTRPRQKPLIFLPGIAGSALGTFANSYWPTLNPPDIYGLSLDPSDEIRSIDPYDAVRIAGAGTTDIYNTFLKMLRDKGGYREVIPTVTRQGSDTRTYAIPTGSELNTPDLFIFPYDWRISNAANAEFLTQYIAEIRKLYPDTDVDLVCHSMGGFVARRYILNHPADHHVGKCVTMDTPVLGAVVAYQRMLAGGFFDKWYLDPVNNEAIKTVLAHFPGFFQLLPSPSFFALQAHSPFYKSVLDTSGTLDSGPLTPPQIKTFFDGMFSDQPVARNEEFHLAAQDDWSGGDSGIRYLHFAGVQDTNHTPTQVAYIEFPYTSPGFFGSTIVTARGAVVSARGLGDKTVPYVSQFPAGLAPNSQTTVLKADKAPLRIDYDDDHSEHTGVTQNPRLHKGLLYFLRTGSKLFTDEGLLQSPGTFAAIPASRELICIGITEVLARDPQGQDTVAPLPGLQAVYPPTVDYTAGNNLAQLLYGATGVYTFTIPTRTQQTILPLIEIKTKDSSGNAVSVVRFLDVVLPAGSNARLVDTGAAPYLLQIDLNGDGTFDQSINASFVASGSASADLTPPTVAGLITRHDGHYFMQLTAQDAGSGVNSLVVQQANSVAAPYAGEIMLTALVNNEVLAFATDNVGNRSALFHFPVVPNPKVARIAGKIRLSWRKTAWPIVAEASTNLGSAQNWQTINVDPIDLGADYGIDVDPSAPSQFFRLKLNVP